MASDNIANIDNWLSDVHDKVTEVTEMSFEEMSVEEMPAYEFEEMMAEQEMPAPIDEAVPVVAVKLAKKKSGKA